MNTKIDINPFTPGRPVPAELFAGRTQQIRQVRNYLIQAAGGGLESVFLTGDRGIGKSSFASILRRLANDDQNMVGIHVFLGGVNDTDELVRRIIEELVKEGFEQPWYAQVADTLGDYISVEKVGLFGATVRFKPAFDELTHASSNFPEVLGELIARISEDKHGVLIILDDINGLAESALFANWYKSMADKVATQFSSFPALIMLSGLPERREQLAAHQPSLLRVFRLVELERLSNDEVRDFFANAFNEAGMRVDDDAMQLMMEYSSGLPTMMQEIGDAIFWITSGGVVNHGDAIAGISEAAINVGRKYLHPNVYNALRSQRYRDIIRKISLDSIGDTTFTRQQIATRLTAEELKVFDNLLRRLRELGVVERDAEGGRGAYRYTNQIYPLYMWMESEGIVRS